MRGAERAFAASLVVIAGFGLAAALAPAAPTADAAQDLARAALAAACAVTALALAWALLSTLPARRALGLGPSRLPWGENALLAAGTLGLSHLLDLAVRAAGLGDRGVLGELASALAGARGPVLLLAVVGLALAPGVAEELLFRGALQGALLRARAVPPWLAIATASLLFGAFHLDPVQGAAAALLGLHLGAVAFAADSLRPAIAGHVANNLAAVATLSLAAEPPGAALQLGLALLVWLPSVAVLARRLPGAGSARPPAS